MLEKLVGKRVSVAVAFVTAGKMNYANITKFYEGKVVSVDKNFIELDRGFININFIQTIEILDK
ncbi:MAG: hypothetical protein IJA30_00630 [Bacilli bacterium]|nr:hypothetical protein [Bacilli bacterium]